VSTQPDVGEAFPYGWDADDVVARRELLRFAVYTSGALFAGTAALAVLAEVRPVGSGAVQRIAPVADVPEGAVHYFRYPSPEDEAVLLHPTGLGPVAFSQRCTHLACSVYYHRERGALVCPCHEGVFDATTGHAVAGPPRRRLARIRLARDDGWIVAVGMTP
jgi:Rieske Fe-S protein